MALFSSNMLLLIALFLSPLAVVRGTGTHNGSTNFYLSSNRKGCVQVESQQPCPVSVLSPDIALDYEDDAETVYERLNETRGKHASQECLAALTTTFCSSLTPRCFVNGSKDYGDASAACWKANSTCPRDTLEEGRCDSLKTGLQPLSSCVQPSKPINGSCPQPKYKMPEEKLDLYTRSSLEYEEISYFENLTAARYSNGSRIFSPRCVSKIKELYCLPFYCSADEQQIVTEYTYEACLQIFYDCFETTIQLLSGKARDEMIDLKYEYDNCDFYPDDPTSSESGDASPTPPAQNMSSTPPVRNVSTTPSRGNITSSPPPEQNVTSSAPPVQNVTSSAPLVQNVTSSAPPVQNVTSTPPGRNVSTAHPGEDTESTSTPIETEQSFPPGKSVPTTLLLVPTTAGQASCRNFPSLLLLFLLLVLVKIV